MIRELYQNLKKQYQSLFIYHKEAFSGQSINPSLDLYFQIFCKEEPKILNKLELKIRKYEEIQPEIISYEESIYHRNAMQNSLDYLKEDLENYKSYYKEETFNNNIDITILNIEFLIQNFEESIK